MCWPPIVICILVVIHGLRRIWSVFFALAPARSTEWGSRCDTAIGDDTDGSVRRVRMRQGILIVFHGGRDPEGIQEFLLFYKDAESTFPNWEVRPAFLEFAEPSVLDALEAMVSEGMDRIVVLPLFLVGATHMKSDLPVAIHAARSRFPHVEFIYSRHLGVHPQLNAILDERFGATERKLAPLMRAETIVL